MSRSTYYTSPEAINSFNINYVRIFLCTFSTPKLEVKVELCNYVDVYYNDFIDLSLPFMQASATESEIEKFSLEIGDVIITKDSEDPMDIAVPALVKEIKPNLVCGYHLTMLKRKLGNFSGAYLFWALKDGAIASQLHREATGVTRWAISSRHIKNIVIALPCLSEQKAITDYLDPACSKIDEMLELKKLQLKGIEKYLARRIDELILAKSSGASVKFSGKDFIGNIPAHYKVSKLKHLTATIVDGTHFTPNYLDAPEEADIPFLRVTDVQVETIDRGRVKYISAQEHSDLTKRCNPEEGDLLLSKNGTIGITKVVDWDWPFSIFVSLCLIKKSELIDTEYLNYFFRSDLMKYQIHQSSKQITVTNLHLDRIREFQIVYPPKREDQLRVVSKIKAVESAVNKTRENIQKQIDTLVSYQKSLIHECVTGKKRVYFGQETK